MKEKKENKHCHICLIAINKKDDYVRLTQYNDGSEVSTAYYHTSCFKTRFMNFKKIQREANDLLGMAKPLMQKAQAQGIF